MSGGAGADFFNVAANSFVMDATAEDFVTWGPYRLTGGAQQWWMEAGWAYYQPFTAVLQTVTTPAGIGGGIFAFLGNILDTAYGYGLRYSVTSGGQLIIQKNGAAAGQAVLEGYTSKANGYDFDAARMPGNIVVYEQVIEVGKQKNLDDFSKLVNLALKAGFGTGLNGTDPLMLDLDGDGLELARRDAASVYFDVDDDGFGERTAWTRNGDDGFLVRDLDGNGQIDSQAEMFGTAATTGFVALAALDSNADGKITAADAAFATLKVWRDLDSDGVTDAGELLTLSQTGITELSLAATPLTNTSIRDSDVRATATFTRADATTGIIADVVLNNSQSDTRWLGDATVSPAAAALPDLTGYGNITGLRIAMTDDATLLGQVTAFAAMSSAATWAQLKDAADDILFRWAGVDTVPATALGADFDARKLAFLEAYVGIELAPRNSQGQPAATTYDNLVATWNDTLDKATARLAALGPHAALFQPFAYSNASDSFSAATVQSLPDALRAAVLALPANPAQAEATWDALYGPLFAEVLAGTVRHDGNQMRVDFAVQSLVRALDGIASPLSLTTLVAGLGYSNVTVGTAGSDTLDRGTARDTHVFVGDGGNDTIIGGAGQDVYVFGRNFGVDTIHDAENGGRDSGDRLRFATLKASEVSISRDGLDLVVAVNANTDRVIVKDYYSTPVLSNSGQQITEDFGIEDIQFADGTIYEAGEIASVAGRGTAASETLDGSGIADELAGLGGNDLLRGGDAGDTYIFSRGNGADTIHDVMTNPLLGAPDSLLLLLGGIRLSDLRFNRTGASDDLTITFGATPT
ncbi:MAG: calcium-binding protein, partial [Vicinamibacterales bacterium]